MAMYKLCRNFTFILIYFTAIEMQAAKTEKIVKLLSITCESVQPKWSTFRKCLLKQMKDDVAEVSVEVVLIVKPINNATIVATLVKRGYEDRRPLVDYKLDCCAFFAKKRRSFLYDFAYKILGFEKYSNMNHSCPFDHDLIVDRYPFSVRGLGKATPFGNGEFALTTEWYSYNELRAIVVIRMLVFDK